MNKIFGKAGNTNTMYFTMKITLYFEKKMLANIEIIEKHRLQGLPR